MADPTQPAPPSEMEPESPPTDPGEFAEAGRARDAIEAGLLADMLEAEGIPAFVDSARAGMVEKLAAPSDGFPVRVPRRDLARAQAFFEERKAALEADPEAAGRAADEAEAAETAEAQATGAAPPESPSE